MTDTPPPPEQPGGFYPSPRAVVTKHVGSLSWLFEQLWTVFQPAMNPVTKFEFFGRLANAASRYQGQVGDNATERDLLGAVVHEAYAILEALDQSSFSAPTITSGGAIFDDAVPDNERPRYVTVHEADSWLAGNDEERRAQ